MASSNLFIAVSLYEILCLRLCHVVENFGDLRLSEFHKDGISNSRSFLKKYGAPFQTLCKYHDTIDIITIRNCLIHADGLPSFSKEEKKVIDTVNKYRKSTKNQSTDLLIPMIMFGRKKQKWATSYSLITFIHGNPPVY